MIAKGYSIGYPCMVPTNIFTFSYENVGAIPMDASKSHDGRTVWEIGNDGKMIEYGGDCYKFSTAAINVEILLELLKRNEKTIHDGAHKERAKLGYGETFTDRVH
jgi:hypothetical protein